MTFNINEIAATVNLKDNCLTIDDLYWTNLAKALVEIINEK